MAEYTNTRGIFALLDVRERQAAGVWSTRGDVWTSPSPFITTQGTDFGYIAGGYVPSSPNLSSTVDRIDYSNDTATAAAKGPLSAAARYVNGVANLTHGYRAGGTDGSKKSTVDRIDFANDTATAAVKGPLNTVRYRTSATGNEDFGYIGGGDAPSTSSTVDRIDYSLSLIHISEPTRPY